MKKYIFILYFILSLSFLSGCSFSFKVQNDEDFSYLPVKTYEVQGTVVAKTDEEITIATAVLTDKVKNSGDNSSLKIGDNVWVLITPEKIITVLSEEQKKSENVVVSEGFDYETLGYIGDKDINDDSYSLQIVGNLVSGELKVSDETFNQMQIGQEVKIFANLDGIQGVAVIAEEKNNDLEPTIFK